MLVDSKKRASHLDRLTGQWVDRPSRSDLEFVIHHVPETLVVDHADVDVCGELFSRDSRIHRLIAVVVVPRGQELLAKVLGRSVRIGESVPL